MLFETMFIFNLLDLSGDIIHDKECHGPLVIPRDLPRVGIAASHLSPDCLSLVNVSLVTSSLGNLSSSPDQLIIVPTPGLIEPSSRWLCTCLCTCQQSQTESWHAGDTGQHQHLEPTFCTRWS